MQAVLLYRIQVLIYFSGLPVTAAFKAKFPSDRITGQRYIHTYMKAYMLKFCHQAESILIVTDMYAR